MIENLHAWAFVSQLIIFLSIFFYKLYNVLSGTTLYGIKGTFITSAIVILTFAVGFFTTMIYAKSLLIRMTFLFETLLFILFTFLTIFESFLMVEQGVTNAQKT